MAAGSTICCSAFDPTLFWDVVEDNEPTWYYASPTMHQMILAEANNRPEALAKSKLRLICNAAGGLLPSLACNLRDTFDCVVLPSYGMTECMPISSPLLDYKLDRPGTSGISVGPELSILDGNDAPMASGAVGRIAVRGYPLFEGYLKEDGIIERSPFTTAGWFDTGDMGYLDPDGYLYLTGRSKEVINRGGELISPFEVEEAILVATQDKLSPIFGRVKAALAFAMPHDTLQEVVGVVLAVPPKTLKPCIRTLRDAVKDSLNQVKWPDFVVYMEDLPRNNNKIVRVKLAQRLGLKDISTDTLLALRHWDAVCPPPNTPLTDNIIGMRCWSDVELVTDELKALIGSNLDVFVRPTKTDGFPQAYIAPISGDVSIAGAPSTDDLLFALSRRIDGPSMPGTLSCLQDPFPRDVFGGVDAVALDKMYASPADAGDNDLEGMSPVESRVARIYAEILQCGVSQLAPSSDFFQMGGDSLRAGRLLSQLRKEFQARLPIDILFTHGSIESVATAIEATAPPEKLRPATTTKETTNTVELPFELSQTRSSTNPLLLIIQLIPIFGLYPMKRALTWTIFMYLLSKTFSWSLSHTLIGRLCCLVICLFIGRAITKFICPFLAIAAKWIIIGRYKPGLYPMWGNYHTRWWFVQKLIAIAGRGHFSYNDVTLVWYYRMLGAKIGRGVKIHKGATLGEYDLVQLDDGVNLDRCIVRAFAVERNTHMLLAPVHLCKDSSVGLTSIVAPGSVIPPGTCIGPNSSSWELQDADETNRDLSSNRIPGANLFLDILVCVPLALLVTVVQGGPWVIGLLGIVKTEPVQSSDPVLGVITWFAAPKRIGFHYLALIMNAYFGPMAWFLAVLVLRYCLVKTVFGPQQPGKAATRSQMQKLRMSLMAKIAPGNRFHELLAIFGSHYEMTSRFYRAMGSRVGKRVYWPGSGPSVQDYELIHVGDDVVFGSRSHLVTSDGYGSTPIVIGNNAMVADRVVILPGVSIGERTVLGSGAVTRYEKHYDSDTVWVGSKQGDAVCLSRPGGISGTATASELISSSDSSVDQEKKGLMTSTTTEFSMSGTSTLCNTPRRLSIEGFDAKTLCGTPRNNSFQNLVSKDGALVASKSSVTLAPSEKSRSLTDIFTMKRSATRPTLKSAHPSMIAIKSLKRSPSTFDTLVAHRNQPKPKPIADSPPSISATAFGRAYYDGLAPYYVYGAKIITAYCSFFTILTAFYWNVSTVSSIQIMARILTIGANTAIHVLEPTHAARPIVVYLLFSVLISLLLLFQTIAILAFIILSKYLLLGTRKPGNYDWDKSPYCQRWQVFLTIEKLRKNCFGGHGILQLLTGTHYIVQYYRFMGADIGQDVALFASGNPSCLLTEPDLLHIGSRVAIDDASLVGHINSRGKFDLNELHVGERSVMRSGTRLLSGARMGADAVLLEHTLVMAGDVVDDASVVQGWPGEEWAGRDRSQIGLLSG